MTTATAVTYRLAGNADGPAIGALYQACDYGDLGVDWTTASLGGWWLLAERAGEVVGAIQVCASRPCGFLGDCLVRPEARARDDAGGGQFGRPGRVTLMLYAHALKALRNSGCQVVLGVTTKPGLKRILTRNGAVSLGATELFAKGLR